MRLIGGSHISAGHVEIYHKLVQVVTYICDSFTVPCHSNEWGAVCDNDWRYSEALVVCKQLGYPDAVENGTGTSIGPVYGRVWIEDVSCTGPESKLEECSIQFVGWDVQNCSHAEVACGK